MLTRASVSGLLTSKLRRATHSGVLCLSVALWAPLWVWAQDTGSPPESPLSGTLEFELVRERSKFNVIRIDEAAVLVSDGGARSTETFRHLSGSLSAVIGCGTSVYCTASAGLDSRTGQSSSDADTGTAQADAGLQWRLGSATMGARYLREQWRVAHNVYMNVQGLAADAAVALNDQISAYALLNLTVRRHPGDSALLDSHYQSVTANLRWATDWGWQSVWTTQATVAREQKMRDEHAFDNRELMLRLAWEATPAPGWELGASVIAQRVHFAKFDPLLRVRRSDRYTGIDLSLSRHITDHLEARLDWNSSAFRSRATVFNNDSDSLGLALAWSF